MSISRNVGAMPRAFTKMRNRKGYHKMKFAVSNLRLFVSGENLLTFTSLVDTFDPETIGVGNWDGCTYQLSQTISFGLSATF